MLKIYDFECIACGEIAEHCIEVARGSPAPRMLEEYCAECDAVTRLRRLPSLPGKYLGDKVENSYAPRIYGGRFDTMGYKREPRLPALQGEDEHAAKVSAAIAKSGAQTLQEKQEVAKSVGPAPKLSDYASLFGSSEWQEAKRERMRARELNRQKRRRAAAMDAGQETVRSWPCEGDNKAVKKGAS
jgi:hypothetical protein